MQQVQLYSLLFQWRLPPLYRSYHAVGKECFLLRSYLLGDSSEEAASSLSVTVSLLVLFWSTRQKHTNTRQQDSEPGLLQHSAVYNRIAASP